MDLIFIRLIFICVVAVACYVLQLFGLPQVPAAAAGAVIGLSVVLFEMRLRIVSLKRLIGAVIGRVLGIVGAYLFSLVIRKRIQTGRTQSFLQLFVIVLMSYLGLTVGANKGDLLNFAQQ